MTEIIEKSDVQNKLNKTLKKLLITLYLLAPILTLVLLFTARIMLNWEGLIKYNSFFELLFLFIGLTPYLIYLVRYTKLWMVIRKNKNEGKENINILISNYRALNKPNFYILLYTIIAIALYISYFYYLKA